MLFHKVCGIDLGTDTIKLRDKSGKHFLYSKNLIATRQDGSVIAIGDAAYEIYEKNGKYYISFHNGEKEYKDLEIVQRCDVKR